MSDEQKKHFEAACEISLGTVLAQDLAVYTAVPMQSDKADENLENNAKNALRGYNKQRAALGLED
jgi:hypothetical protein